MKFVISAEIVREYWGITGGTTMQKYVCNLCGYIYDPEIGDPDNGVAAGTAFADLPEDWVCPDCGAGVDDFEPVD